eukprot:m.306967 g.306967  ORF g.306967 m.306967 type:complete len:157 (+) comp41783_c0_seq1:141-611(+)
MGEGIDWTPDLEIALFNSMQGHKPVGVSKHFQMIFIHGKLSRDTSRSFTTSQIWGRLQTMYNLDELNDLEANPFPMDRKDFSLPEEYTMSESENNTPTSKVAPKTPSASDAPSPAAPPESPGTGRRKRTRTLSSNPSPSSPVATVPTSKRRRGVGI